MTKRGEILVTGGCGYIGSHVCAQLSRQGYKVIVIDNLSTGSEKALLHGETLVRGDFGDPDLLKSVFSKYSIQAIFHFAASIIVGESVKEPFQYYENNSIKFYIFLKELVDAGVERLILSSTAAVYGVRTDSKPIREDGLLAPISPYGRSKLFDEWLLEDVAKVAKIRYVALRYFNVAGASENKKLGQRGKGTHLVKVACEAALNPGRELAIFGTDYPTDDGTCVRDYIHVEDLASAHIKALHYLENGGENQMLNCGYNHGYSVREVLKSFETMLGRKLPILEKSRRPGDVPYLIADSSKIGELLGWKSQYDDLPSILRSAWEWEQICGQEPT